MTVPSPEFLLFAAAAALLYNLPFGMRWRQLVLCAANLGFLASFSLNALALAPLAGFLALGFAAQRGRLSPRGFMALLVLMVAIFAWLKRYSFVPTPLIVAYPYLLIGLSYIFFRVLHVMIDRHQRAIEAPLGGLSYLNYTLNFSTLISGPIQRYEDFRRMECAPLGLDLAVAGRAVERIVIGFFKVAILSMALSRLQHQAILALGAGGSAWTRIGDGAVVAGLYPIYLYFNFSGYTDVVIGVARFLRIELPENFDRPFAAENVLMFWNRWHMTLSGWLKTYVFNPLMLAGMSRVTAPRLSPFVAVVAFFITFFLVGLWHGSTASFIVFGLLTGGGVAANKLWQVVMQQRIGRSAYRALAANPLYRAGGRGLNFTWFAFTLLWFWSSPAQLRGFCAALGPVPALLVWPAIFAISTIGLAAMQVATGATAPVFRSRYLRTASATALSVATVAITALLHAPAPDIVYKAF